MHYGFDSQKLVHFNIKLQSCVLCIFIQHFGKRRDDDASSVYLTKVVQNSVFQMPSLALESLRDFQLLVWRHVDTGQ